MNSTPSLDPGATVRIAFAGLRHPHIFDLFKRCQASPAFEIVAVCEADATSAREAQEKRGICVTHHELDAMLASTPCDVVAIGDYYGIRGATALAALRAGRHVIADKPLCTRLAELEEIEALCRREGLRCGCMLDLRNGGLAAVMRETVGSGRLGEVQSIHFNGQHPLNYGSRAGWYFEPGKHGGTINDIAVHALDLIPWVVGAPIRDLLCANVWEREIAPGVTFQVGGQCMFRLANGAGVLGDVSYLAPDSFGYSLPCYWEFRVWGSKGLMEGSAGAPVVRFYEAGQSEVQELPRPAGRPGGYLQDFLADLRGESGPDALRTADVLRAARHALELQALGDAARGQPSKIKN